MRKSRGTEEQIAIAVTRRADEQLGGPTEGWKRYRVDRTASTRITGTTASAGPVGTHGEPRPARMPVWPDKAAETGGVDCTFWAS